MHCISALSIRNGQVQLCDSLDSLDSLLMFDSEVNVSATQFHTNPQTGVVYSDHTNYLTVHICLTFFFNLNTTL